MLYLIVFGLLAALLWAYLKWNETQDFWAKRGVPHDKPHFLFGSLTFLQKQNPGIWMRKLYVKFQKPYVGIWLFWRPALVVNSPEIARRILIKDADNFRNRLLGSGSATSDPIGGLNLFTVNDPTWSSIRRRLTSVFTSSKLRALHDLKISKSRELVKRITNDLKQNKEIELRSTYADYSTDVIGVAAFGVDCDATLTGTSPMRNVTRDFMQFDFIRGLAWTSIFFLPEAVNIFKFSFFPKNTIAYFRKVYETIVAQRGNDGSDKDLLGALLKMKQEAIMNNEDIDDDIVIAQAAIFLQGGFDTTAVTLSFLTYELAYHQDVQEKMYKELLEAKQKLGDKEFDGTVLSGLPYLNSVVKETLRKYPPMGWLDRFAEKSYQIDEKVTIPAGTPVYINANGLHYDPEFFPDPDAFIPERFLPENESKVTPFTFLPFGDGPRNCIGMRFAHRVVWYAVASVFMEYKVLPKPNSKRPTQIEIEKRGLFLMPGEGMFVDFVQRN